MNHVLWITITTLLLSTSCKEDNTSQAKTSTDATTACDGTSPMCTRTCGDIFNPSQCDNGEWVCPEGMTFAEDCPQECEPWTTGALDDCPQSATLCSECHEFDGTYEDNECSCSCDEGVISCNTTCLSQATSDLNGVSLTLTNRRCRWTLDEAAQGIEFTYTLTITEDIENVTVDSLDLGNCAQPDESGLKPFYQILGDDGQQWCHCDIGLCRSHNDTENNLTTLGAGTYTGSFVWNGVNWMGPSDSFNPEGPPFPVGRYTVKLETRGQIIDATQTTCFGVDATFAFILTE